MRILHGHCFWSGPLSMVLLCKRPVVRDILLEGLPLLDYLEVFNSTTDVSSLIGCDQSSVSRVYRYVSERLNLGFAKNESGFYSASRNLDVLADLRRVSQRLRLNDPKRLRFVGQYWNEALLHSVALVGPLSRQWFGLDRVYHMLREQIIDLAVVNTIDLGINSLLLRRDAKSTWMHRDLAGFSLFSYPIGALAHVDHPLQSSFKLSRNDLWSFPSPAQPDKAFPFLSSALKERGLWQDLVPEGYRFHRWEGRCRDRKTIAYHTPLIFKAVSTKRPLQMLPVDLKLWDVEAVVCLRDMSEYPSVRAAVELIRLRYQSMLLDVDGLEWIT